MCATVGKSVHSQRVTGFTRVKAVMVLNVLMLIG